MMSNNFKPKKEGKQKQKRVNADSVIYLARYRGQARFWGSSDFIKPGIWLIPLRSGVVHFYFEDVKELSDESVVVRNTWKSVGQELRLKQF